ncbi:hypothetical protein Tsubulata_037234 [Turnera subulata]|uniref:E3 ubiquitin-protein ligase RMA n=1 Tax=Turnera subulata TaxID=218843 RepID=A0A9Q0GHC2_9ROSI|nr:hypothetical protein Tsubulata_037234 [Turnera subulata]
MNFRPATAKVVSVASISIDICTVIKISKGLIMDHDSNQEAADSTEGSVFGLGYLLNELETTHDRIEERIRRLEVVTTRARQRQRWRQNQPTLRIASISAEPIPPVVQVDDGIPSGVFAREGSPGTSITEKKSSTYLIAKALSRDTDSKKTRSDVESIFDCNICLVMAREPVLTRCGHMFCWPCFYQLSYVYANVKECPVCMEEVKDTSIIPIYGNGNGKDNHKFYLESGLKVPPRPQAHRVESVRQQLINNGVFSSPMDERIRQFSNLLREMREQPSPVAATTSTVERTSSMADSTFASQVLPAMDIEGSQHQHSLQISRLLLQGAASFSSLSSALNSAMDSAERLVEDLEEFIQRFRLRRNRQRSSVAADSSPFSSAGVQPDRQIPDVTGVNSIMPHSAESFRSGSTTHLHPGSLRIDTASGSNSTLLNSSSSRRRNEISRLMNVDRIQIGSTTSHSSLSPRRRLERPEDSDLDNDLLHEPRRRRLR